MPKKTKDAKKKADKALGKPVDVKGVSGGCGCGAMPDDPKGSQKLRQ